MNISEMRTRVRVDLHDEAAAGRRWTDDELDRHILHAVRQLSLSVPREATAMLTAGGESGREVSLASLTGLVTVEVVEHPVELFPPAYQPFSLWGGSLTLLGDPAPRSGDLVRVYYGRLHTLDASGSSIPAGLEDLVAVGAERLCRPRVVQLCHQPRERRWRGGVEAVSLVGSGAAGLVRQRAGGPRQPQPREACAPLHAGAACVWAGTQDRGS